MKKLFTLLFLFCFIGLFAQLSAEAPSSYYKTNPTLGKKTSTPIVIDGNPSEWTQEMLIVQGVANDDARSFRGPHEAPVYDLYQLYAAWDDTNLYLMWQITNVSDVVCPEQGYPNSDNGKPWNGDIPFQLAFDIDSSTGTDALISGKTTPGVKDSHVWGVYTMFSAKNVDKLLMFSAKPGVGQPGVFSLNASGAFDYQNVKLFNQLGVEYKWGDYCVASNIYGINKNQHTGYVTSDLADETNYVDFCTKGHNKAMDTAYEMKIPLTALGINSSYLESTGIGVMLVSTFGQSGINSLPYDAATFDNASEPYSSDASTSKEKEDVDVFSANFARIGAGGGTVVVRPTLTVSPVGGKYIGGTNVTLSASGEKSPISIYYTLDGTTPTTSSSLYTSPVSITTNNTVLKAKAIDSEGTESYVATHTYITEEPPAPKGITVGLKKPDGWSNVNIWAWTGTSNNLFTSWPGVQMTTKDNTWYYYTFDESVTSVNVVFSTGTGFPQSVDITGIATSTCYEKSGESAGKITVNAVTCPDLTGLNFIENNNAVSIFPNPAYDYISVDVPSTGSTITIFSSEGNRIKILNNYQRNDKISVSSLPDGIYFIRAVGDNGQVYSAKWVKK